MLNNVGHISSSIQTPWQKFLGSSNRIVVAAIAAIALVAVLFLALRHFAPRSFQNCFSPKPSSSIPQIPTILPDVSSPLTPNPDSGPTRASSKDLPLSEVPLPRTSEQIAFTSSNSAMPRTLQSLLDPSKPREMDSGEIPVISALRTGLLPYTLLQTSKGSLIEITRGFTSFVESESQKILNAKISYFDSAPTLAEITPQDGEWQSLTVYAYRGRPTLFKQVVIDIDSHNFEGRFGSSHVQFASCIGPRAEMEDTHIATVLRNGIRVVGVFDGHGGDRVARLARDRIGDLLTREFEQMGGGEDSLSEEDLLERSILALNNAFIQLDVEAYELVQTLSGEVDPGTTAIVTLIVGNKLVVANLGDSRAMLVKDDQPVQLTLDAEPNIPRFNEQVRALGGLICRGRVFNLLATPAAIGDHRCMSLAEDTRKSIVNIPEISLFEFVPGRDRVVIGCDGQWDTVSVNEIFQTLRERSKSTIPLEVSDATILARTALLTRPKPDEGRPPDDNVTVGIISL